jgi:hypothetical protein
MYKSSRYIESCTAFNSFQHRYFQPNMLYTSQPNMLYTSTSIYSVQTLYVQVFYMFTITRHFPSAPISSVFATKTCCDSWLNTACALTYVVCTMHMNVYTCYIPCHTIYIPSIYCIYKVYIRYIQCIYKFINTTTYDL